MTDGSILPLLEAAHAAGRSGLSWEEFMGIIKGAVAKAQAKGELLQPGQNRKSAK